MKNAGIKVWVLTGDKIETAIEIGYAAGLLDDASQMTQHLVDETDKDKLHANLCNVFKTVKIEMKHS
jgi:P-type E1-E2 ATPase